MRNEEQAVLSEAMPATCVFIYIRGMVSYKRRRRRRRRRRSDHRLWKYHGSGMWLKKFVGTLPFSENMFTTAVAVLWHTLGILWLHFLRDGQ
jgi:hypothetical protein